MGDNGCTQKSGCNNGGLRGFKGSSYEGGIRVPLAISWPGSISPQTFAAPVMSFDLLPTLLAAVGAPTPAKTDGVNLLPYLGRAGSAPSVPGVGRAEQRGDPLRHWKLVDGELYNLAADPGERHKLSAANTANAKKIAELTTKRAALVKGWKPPLWRADNVRRASRRRVHGLPDDGDARNLAHRLAPPAAARSSHPHTTPARSLMRRSRLSPC